MRLFLSKSYDINMPFQITNPPDVQRGKFKCRKGEGEPAAMFLAGPRRRKETEGGRMNGQSQRGRACAQTRIRADKVTDAWSDLPRLDASKGGTGRLCRLERALALDAHRGFLNHLMV